MRVFFGWLEESECIVKSPMKRIKLLPAERKAKEFLEANHSYGYAACKYCYGMFLKRHTGHIAQQMESGNTAVSTLPNHSPGTLVAVATFSNARKWIKGNQTIRSYEWTRYASLPDVRLSGGMGKMLKTFIIEDGGNYQKAADMFFDMASEFTLEVMLHGKAEDKVWQSILQKHRKTLSDMISAFFFYLEFFGECPFFALYILQKY